MTTSTSTSKRQKNPLGKKEEFQPQGQLQSQLQKRQKQNLLGH